MLSAKTGMLVMVHQIAFHIPPIHLSEHPGGGIGKELERLPRNQGGLQIRNDIAVDIHVHVVDVHSRFRRGI